MPSVITKATTFQRIRDVNDHGASLVVMLLLCADVAFIVLHSIDVLTPYLNSRLFSFENEGSYPDVYQYIKWFWTTILLGYLAVSQRSPPYGAWVLVFTYFLCDDALRIHELAGTRVAEHLTFTPPLELRLQDFGELAVSAAVGTILLAIVAWAYSHGSRAFRKLSRDLLLMVLALAFFGVVIDTVHMAISSQWTVAFILSVVEDGGEMVVASLMLWYVFLTSSRRAFPSTMSVPTESIDGAIPIYQGDDRRDPE